MTPGPIMQPSQVVAPAAVQVVPAPQPQPSTQADTLEYEKQVAKQLLDALDDEALWQLAYELQSRGLIGGLPGASPGAQATGQMPYSLQGSAGAAPFVLGMPYGQQVPYVAVPAYGMPEMYGGQVAAPSAPQAGVPSMAPSAEAHWGYGAVPAAAAAPMSAAEASYMVAAHVPPLPAAVFDAPAGHTEAAVAPTLTGAATAGDSNFKSSDQVGSSAPGFGSAAGGNAAPPAPAGGTHASSADAGGSEDIGGGAGEESATSLILRNLPETFDQDKCQAWVDQKYRGLYDFMLWFPAKKTSRLNNCSYAFVNFRSAELARRFRQEYHLHRFEADGEKQQWPLSIAVAKVQGFAENYLRFSHLLTDKMHTLCNPFFAEDAIENLTPEQREAATHGGNAPAVAEADLHSSTTVVIRNLPSSLDGQVAAMRWFDGAGFRGTYNFFFYLPAKRRKADPVSSQVPGFAYAFVNFRSSGTAKACVEQLNGQVLSAGDPTLNVVPSKVQGFVNCCNHFSTLSESGRLEPWIEAGATVARQYQ